MLKIEKNYDFRKRLCTPHKRVIRDKNDLKRDNEYEIKNGCRIYAEGSDEVLATAIADFKAYLKTAFGLSSALTQKEEDADISMRVCRDGLGENANGYMGRKTEVKECGIVISAFDFRGIAQALYALEERMNSRHAPYLTCGITEERPAYTPRMVHSGYGIDEFPDDYLATCAHHGYDAILAFVKDKNHSAHGECDFCDIVRRAKKYGIDVYAYSYINNFHHPDEEGAKEHFGELYGGLFRDIPGLRGIVFVGESIEFPSHDPHVSPRHYYEIPANGIPDGKITPGWWPCEDYPQWISLVRDSVRAVSPDADIVFWTYNFGYVEEKHRVALLEKMPTDISLLVTFEMFDRYPMGEGIGQVCDYTVSNIGPGKYFESEAAVAAKRGIKLYSQVNTAGRTWDFGVAPYEPFPNQWNKRHEAINACREKYGLSGLMESHHFGFLPSMITRIAKNNYTLGGVSYDEKLIQIAHDFAPGEEDAFISAMATVSSSMEHYVASDENQYGPFRIGPAYPLCLVVSCKLPNQEGAHFGNGIYYTLPKRYDSDGMHDPYGLRVRGELAEAKKARTLVKEGLAALRKIKNKNVELERLINLVSFIEKCYITAINAISFRLAREKLLTAPNKKILSSAISEIERIAKAEIKNAGSAIPIVERDSAIGFEPSMLYQCDRRGIEWKLEQVRNMLDMELNLYRRAVDPESVKGRYFRFR